MKKRIGFKLFCTSQWLTKNGYSIKLVVRKDHKRKIIALNLYALPHQWDPINEVFVTDKRIKNLHPDRIVNNEYLTRKKADINKILTSFEDERIDWTVNQFEDRFLNITRKGKVSDYFKKHISILKETGHTGNADCYINTFHILGLYDKKINSRLFSEIDVKYVNDFDNFLQKRGCRGNTRKYYFKALRAILNKAIKENEASQSTYPFGKGGFEISKLGEVTEKRYLSFDYLAKLKSCTSSFPAYELSRRLFLFSYYCYGISFMDMAQLTHKNIAKIDEGEYIIYKRQKTQGQRSAYPIRIKITDDIRNLLEWFKCNAVLNDDYIVPVVSRSGYSGEQLYRHIKSRYVRITKNLKGLAGEFEMKDVNLTSYVSRHTMAMQMQNNAIPREVISQILGHNDLKTTNTYLDSFSRNVIDEAAKVL